MNKSDKQAIKAGKQAVKTAERNYRNEVRANRRESVQQAKNVFGLILGGAILLLLIFNLYKFAMGKEFVTFTGVLNFLSGVDVGVSVPNVTDLIRSFTIQKEWSILDGLRIFINGLGTILGVVAYLFSNLLYTVTFATKFVVFLLG